MAENFVDELIRAIKPKPEKNRTHAAIVSKVDSDGVAWVYVAGSDRETPIASAASEIKRGDAVNVEWRNNKLYIAGNYSNPSAGVTRVTNVENAAQVANQLAGQASESAAVAQDAADRAVRDADTAHQAANTAQASADRSLVQLSIVEDVAGTLNWISEHGEYVATTDTTVNPDTIYFKMEDEDYVPIANPDPSANPTSEGWYVLDITDSQTDYIMAHLAVTSAGLWVLPSGRWGGHTIVDSDGNVIVDSSGNPIVDWTIDPQSAASYKVLLSASGMTVFDDSGMAVASYGKTTTIGKESSKHVFIDDDSLDIMDGDVTLGSFGSDGISLGDKEMLSIAPNGTTRDLYREESFGTINLPATVDVSTGNVYGLVEDGDTMRVMTKPFLWRAFQKGTPHTRTADDVTVEYDGGSIFVVTSETLTSCVFYFKGVVEHQKCGVFTFGDRTPGAKGSFSSTFGEGLIAIANDQFVIGRYNNSDTNKLFIVGCGTGDEDRSNGFTINSIGNIESADGFKSKKEFYTITTTNAESIMGVKRSGIVMLTIKNINNLASGDNVVATLPSDLKATMPVYMLFGTPSYTPLLRLYISSNDNDVHVYNYGSAITSDSNASVTVTYVAL